MDRFSHYIDGCFDEGGAQFESLDPATGAPWAVMPLAGAAEVDRAVQTEHGAFVRGAWPAWSSISMSPFSVPTTAMTSPR